MPSNFKASLNNPFPVLKKDNIRFVPAKNWNGVVEVPVVCVSMYPRKEQSSLEELPEKERDLLKKVIKIIVMNL